VVVSLSIAPAICGNALTSASLSSSIWTSPRRCKTSGLGERVTASALGVDAGALSTVRLGVLALADAEAVFFRRDYPALVAAFESESRAARVLEAGGHATA